MARREPNRKGNGEMDSRPIIAVLKGGVSPEREVSLKSGEAAAEALGRLFRVEVFDVIEEALPIGLGPRRHVAFSTLHGVFGEDGQVQRLMEEAGVVYAGCDSESSHVTFDKARTKDLIANVACPVLDDARFQRDAPPEPEEVVEKLGGKLALKPNRQGSSIGLRLLEGAEALGAAMKDLEFEDWLIEPLVEGREVSVGIVGDAVGEIVEIIPRSGQYDYESKYTKGMTDYRAPFCQASLRCMRLQGFRAGRLHDRPARTAMDP